MATTSSSSETNEGTAFRFVIPTAHRLLPPPLAFFSADDGASVKFIPPLDWLPSYQVVVTTMSSQPVMGSPLASPRRVVSMQSPRERGTISIDDADAIHTPEKNKKKRKSRFSPSPKRKRSHTEMTKDDVSSSFDKETDGNNNNDEAAEDREVEKLRVSIMEPSPPRKRARLSARGAREEDEPYTQFGPLRIRITENKTKKKKLQPRGGNYRRIVKGQDGQLTVVFGLGKNDL